MMNKPQYTILSPKYKTSLRIQIMMRMDLTYMKEKLVNHFGNRIIITEISRMRNVFTFRDTAYSILQDFYNQPKDDNLANEKMRIIETAAKLIKSEVKSVVQLNDNYPTSAEMSSTDSALAFVPESLEQLLRKLAVGKKTDTKIASIGQAIMQFARPKALISSLQIGLGVQMHRHFASKFLIDSLHQHGFCSSYQEVQRFERCAAVSHGTELPNICSGQFLQYVADNVDHNTRTIDGLNTFHGMGMTATVTPRTDARRTVPRITVTQEDIAAVGRIKIKYHKSCNGLGALKYEMLEDMQLQLQNRLQFQTLQLC